VAATAAHEQEMLSSKAKYAVRAALCLAVRSRDGKWTQAAEVAEQEKIPRKFLEAILVQLRDQGILESRRGAMGGHRLLRDAEAISIADIIRIVDGPLALTPCASRTRFRQCMDCVDVQECRLRSLMLQARDAVAGVLENQSLASLAAEELPRTARRSPEKSAPDAERPARKAPPAARRTRAPTASPAKV
jgi:Rrf2 family protein